MTFESRIAAVTERIGKALFPRGTIKDTVVWDGGERAGWIMDARRLRRVLSGGDDGLMAVTGEQVHYTLRSLGIKDRMFEYERGRLAPSDFLDRIRNVIGSEIEENDDRYLYYLTFIPEPGYPWPEPYYSLKNGKIVQGDRPWWLAADEPSPRGRWSYDESETGPALDFCKFIPPLTGYETGDLVLRLGRSTAVVTHAMGTMADVTRSGTWKQNTKAINDCGGLLFPSLAIGVPATNFGPFVLVADVGIITRSLKPGRGRGETAPAQVFDTDVWTMKTGDFMTSAGRSAFRQLTGDSQWLTYLDTNIWSLGLPTAPELHGPGVGTALERMPQLKRELAKRRSMWPRSMSPEEQLEVYQSADMKSRYPYLEAKVNGIMPIGSFPMAVQPKQASDGFRGFLNATGFDGELLSVDLPDEIALVMSDDWDGGGLSWEARSSLKAWAERQYAWHVQDAIIEASE